VCGRAEALKRRLNVGQSSDLYFYRNASGTAEVDLLLEDGVRLLPREIKSSSTYNSAMSDGMRAFCRLTDKAVDPLVVYSGQNIDSVAGHYADSSRWCGH